MGNKTWYIDGKETATVKSPVKINWEDHQFFNFEYNGELFHGEILEEKLEDRILKIKLNHRVFEIKKGHPLDQLIASMGLDQPKVRKMKELIAPMPGRIVNVEVEVGQAIEVGSPILSLEAMKMENVLKAEGVGTVKAIHCSTDDIVDKGTILIEFE